MGGTGRSPHASELAAEGRASVQVTLNRPNIELSCGAQ
jgi:hypothetical protein